MDKNNEVQEQEVSGEELQKTAAILSAVGDLIVVGKKVMKDGKFDANDTVYILPAIQKVPQYITAFSGFKGVADEFKGFTLAKGLKIVQLIDAEVKKVEAANKA